LHEDEVILLPTVYDDDPVPVGIFWWWVKDKKPLVGNTVSRPFLVALHGDMVLCSKHWQQLW